jgi:hypothetical protein
MDKDLLECHSTDTVQSAPSLLRQGGARDSESVGLPSNDEGQFRVFVFHRLEHRRHSEGPIPPILPGVVSGPSMSYSHHLGFVDSCRIARRHVLSGQRISLCLGLVGAGGHSNAFCLRRLSTG